MKRWKDVEREAPGLAARVRAAFDAGTNKTLATVRRDGAPRISGTELRLEEGRATLGMMPASRKLGDVRRDARVAIHSPTLEPEPGHADDAKLAGRLVEVAAPERVPGGAEVPEGAYFELDITEVVYTWVDVAAGELVVESWHPGRGVEVVRRK